MKMPDAYDYWLLMTEPGIALYIARGEITLDEGRRRVGEKIAK